MDNKTLVITIVLVFVVGLILGDLTSSGTTGQVTKSGSVTSVSVSPRTINAGDLLTVTVIPGSQGASTDYVTYRENEAGGKIRIGQAMQEYCRSSGKTCTTYQRFTLRTSPTWKEGSYYVQVLDKGTDSYVRAYFFVN